MPAIEIGITLIALEVERIARGVGKRSQREVRERVAPGVCCLESQAVAEAAIDPQLQCMVTRVTVRHVSRNVSDASQQTIIGKKSTRIVSNIVSRTLDAIGSPRI